MGIIIGFLITAFFVFLSRTKILVWKHQSGTNRLTGIGPQEVVTLAKKQLDISISNKTEMRRNRKKGFYSSPSEAQELYDRLHLEVLEHELAYMRALELLRENDKITSIQIHWDQFRKIFPPIQRLKRAISEALKFYFNRPQQ